MKHWKRILSALLVLAMTLGLAPMPAAAAEQTEATIPETTTAVTLPLEVTSEAVEPMLEEANQPMPADAATSGSCGKKATWSFDEATGTLTISGEGGMAHNANAKSVPWYPIRESIKQVRLDNGITSIGTYAFSDCTNLTDVAIPDSVTYIGERAFYKCSTLPGIAIGNGVTSIGDSVFFGCTSLTDVTIPDSVTSIGDYAFYNCTALPEIVIGNGVTTIGEKAFYNCTSLATITIPASLSRIKSEAFYNCTALTSVSISDLAAWCKIEYGYSARMLRSNTALYLNGALLTDCVIPEGVAYIADGAFAGCNSLTSLTIPASIAAIGMNAFSDCDNLTSVRILGNEVRMQSSAFALCDNLAEVVVGSDSLEGTASASIGSSAFQACKNLTNVVVGNSVASIGSSAFYGCSGLTSITLGNGLASIGGNAFSGCTNLTSVYISDLAAWCSIELGSSYSSPFPKGFGLYLNGELLTDCVIPEGVTAIGANLFNGYKHLTSLTIPASVVTIGEFAFSNCDGLTKAVIGGELSGSADTGTIGTSAFYGCENLTDVTIGNSIATISKLSFGSCENLRNVIIGDNVTAIGERSFNDCSSLQSITVPVSLKQIQADAFSGCSVLADIYYDGTKAQWDKISISSTNSAVIGKTTIHCADGDISEAPEATTPVKVVDSGSFSGRNQHWELTSDGTLTIFGEGDMPNFRYHDNAPPWGYGDKNTSITRVVIGEGITSVGNSAFLGCVNLTSVSMPDSLTSIGSSAFQNCGKLTDAAIPGGVTSIGSGAFSGCGSLTNAVIPSGLTTIEASAFSGCAKLPAIRIPEGVTRIGNYAFQNCSGISEIVIPDGVAEIGTNAFGGCSGVAEITISEKNPNYCERDGALFTKDMTHLLQYPAGNAREEYTIPDSVLTIGEKAFFGCVSLKKVTLPTSVSAIDFAFHGCTSLTEAILPEGISSVGSYAFYGCTSLREITIPDSAVIIDHRSFDSCTSLATVNMPAKGEAVEWGAFLDCSSLTSIVIPDGVAQIPSSVFKGCTSLTRVTIPASVISIAYGAFADCTALTDVYYSGTQDQWDSIPIDSGANDALLGATIHVGAAAEPGEPIPEGFLPISTAQALYAMAQNEGAKYILTADINITDFEPISSFSGELDGNGHTISGVDYEITSSISSVGLFKTIEDAYIHDLTISGHIRLSDQWGDNTRSSGGGAARSTGTVLPTNTELYVGGLAAKAEGDVTLESVTNQVRIHINTEQEFDDYDEFAAGGLIGLYDCEKEGTLTLRSCINEVPVTGIEMVGGLVGRSETENGTTSLYACSNYGAVSAREGGVGGLIGALFYNGTITDCRNYADVSGGVDTTNDDDPTLNTNYGIGGIIGISSVFGIAVGVVNLSGCLNAGNISGEDTVGGLAGSHLNGTIASSANYGTVKGKWEIGGIVGQASDVVRDCLNAGDISSSSTGRFTYYGGIAGQINEGIVQRCVNVGDVSGGEYNSAIGVPWNFGQTKEEAGKWAEDQIKDCYWLPTENTNTLYSHYGYFSSMAGSTDGGTVDWPEKQIRTGGMLTAEEMKLESSFPGFSFPDVWVMDTEKGYPYPTGQLCRIMENTYQEEYIEKTSAFLDDSALYKTLMGGSGDGSFSGILGDTFERSKRDKANKVWRAMNYGSSLLEGKLPELTDYDILLADLIAGSVSQDIRDEIVVSETLNNASTVLTVLNKASDAKNIQALEDILGRSAVMRKISNNKATEIMGEFLEKAQNIGLNGTSLAKFNSATDVLGNVTGIIEVGTAGIEDVWDAFEYYVMCNSQPLITESYGNLILNAAKETQEIDYQEGLELTKDAQEFYNTLKANLSGTPQSMYDAFSQSLFSLLSKGTSTIIDAGLKIPIATPFLAYLKTATTAYTVGVSMGNALTNMDSIAHYGRMLELCSLFAKGLHAEVLECQDAFVKNKTIETAQKLNHASTLYVNTQILACEYACGYSNSIFSSSLSQKLHINKEEFNETIQLQGIIADLINLRDDSKSISIGKDGSINGFVANCPVIVEVKDKDGTVIARMETGKISTASGYEHSYFLLGKNLEHKAGVYNPDIHTVTITGESDGTMDLMVYTSQNGSVDGASIYRDVPISEGETYTITNTTLEGEDSTILPTQTIDYTEDTELTYGDVNGDGFVDSYDAALILKYDVMLIGDGDLDLSAADVSNDGFVDSYDASLILKYDVMLIDKFPVEEQK